MVSTYIVSNLGKIVDLESSQVEIDFIYNQSKNYSRKWGNISNRRFTIGRIGCFVFNISAS